MANIAILISDAEDGAVDINVRSDTEFSLSADPSHFTPAEGTAVMLLQALQVMQSLEVEEPSLVDELLEERKAEAAAE